MRTETMDVKSRGRRRAFAGFPLKNEKKGALTVEAAIFLPIFIIAVLTIAYLLKLIAAQENVFHSLADEMRVVAAEAIVSPYPLFFEKDAAERIASENGSEIENLRFTDFRYRYGTGEYTEQIRAKVSYDIGVKLPAALIGTIPVSDSILCRAFTGKDNADTPMPASELEEEAESVIVWIFPRSGTRYHGAACSYIVVYPKEATLNASLRRAYSPCKLCKPGSLFNGSLVYCFEKTGEVFHRGSCTAVDRYVISIEKAEAEARGYTPCLKCGGR
jgi:hypothetical protein